MLRYLCITFICLASVFVGGCSKTTGDVSTGFYDVWIDYVTFEYSDGSIVQKYTVDVNINQLAEDGRTAQQIVSLEQNIEDTFEDFFYTDTFAVRYAEIENEISARQDMSSDAKFDYMAGFRCDILSDFVKGEIVAQRSFKSLNHYRDFYEDSGFTISSDTQIDENLFFNRYVNGRKNIYYYNAINMSDFWGLDKEGVYLTETYASPNTEIKSNADLTEITQGIKMHQWEINSLDQSIEFYSYVPVTTDWYVLALILTAFFTLMIALFSISRIDETKPPMIKLKKRETFVNLKDIIDE